MNAFRTILTHFSQRYPSMPPLPATVSNTIVAFDFMTITFRNLLWAPAATSALSVAFPPVSNDLKDEEYLELEGCEVSEEAPIIRKKISSCECCQDLVQNNVVCAACTSVTQGQLPNKARKRHKT